MTYKLAILGGKKTRKNPMPHRFAFGNKENQMLLMQKEPGLILWGLYLTANDALLDYKPKRFQQLTFYQMALFERKSCNL